MYKFLVCTNCVIVVYTSLCGSFKFMLYELAVCTSVLLFVLVVCMHFMYSYYVLVACTSF